MGREIEANNRCKQVLIKIFYEPKTRCQKVSVSLIGN